MAQLVDFPCIPNTKPGDYQGVVNGLLAHIAREEPDYRELKRYMRSRSIFDKDSADQLFKFLGISAGKGKSTTLNSIGRTLLDADEDLEWKKTLFLNIAKQNEILIKYVFDGLTERLYSVNEMYRVITSYVYPGKVITLNNFKNWMAWIEATAMIKYIGIRWGPAPLTKEVNEYLLGIDVEDLLEDEAEEDLDDLDFDLDMSPEPDPAELAAPDPPASQSAEEVPDMPPGGLPDFDDDDDEPVARPTGPAVAGQPIAAMPTYTARLTLRSVAEIEEVQKVLELDHQGAELAERVTALDEAEIAHNLEGFEGLVQNDPERNPLRLSDFGLDPGDYTKRGKKNKKGFFVYRALVAASCAYRPAASSGSGIGPSFVSTSRFNALVESGALEAHYSEQQSIDEVIAALVASGHGSRLDVLALAPFMSLARQALLDSDDCVSKLEKKKNEKTFWEEIYQRLHCGVFTIELVWLVREFKRAGLWKQDFLDQTLCVPDQASMDTAFRLGLLPSPYLNGMPSTLYAARILTGFLGDQEGLEEALHYFADQMGCNFACPQRKTCTYYCRERLRR